MDVKTIKCNLRFWKLDLDAFKYLEKNDGVLSDLLGGISVNYLSDNMYAFKINKIEFYLYDFLVYDIDKKIYFKLDDFDYYHSFGSINEK